MASESATITAWTSTSRPRPPRSPTSRGGAGVSLATASRALNGSAGRQVGALLLDRVRQAATELD